MANKKKKKEKAANEAKQTILNYNAIVKKPEIIVSMPAETIENIVSFFDYDQTFFDFRLCCKTAEVMSRRQFIRRFFTQTYQMWSRWSLRELKEISTCTNLAKQVTTVNLSLHNITHVPEDRFWKGTQVQRIKYNEFIKEENRFSADQALYVVRFIMALEALPSLKTLNLTNLAPLSHKCPFPPAVRRLIDGTGTMISEHCQQACTATRAQWETKKAILKIVIHRLSKSTVLIDNLSLGCKTNGSYDAMSQPCCVMRMSAGLQRSKAFIAAFENIKVLTARLELRSSTSEVDSTAAWISNMGQLVKLRLSIVSPHYIPRRTPLDDLLDALCQHSNPRSLKAIDIWYSRRVLADSLIHYLAHVGKTLEELKLSAMMLVAGSWSELFKFLLIPDEGDDADDVPLPKLTHLDIIHVREEYEGQPLYVHRVLLENEDDIRCANMLDAVLEPCFDHPDCEEGPTDSEAEYNYEEADWSGSDG